MPQSSRFAKGRTRVIRAVIEVVFILFLFYANLLMGEFTRSNAHGKTLTFALHDIVTPQNFIIALFTAIVGYFIYESFRRSVQAGRGTKVIRGELAWAAGLPCRR